MSSPPPSSSLLLHLSNTKRNPLPPSNSSVLPTARELPLPEERRGWLNTCYQQDHPPTGDGGAEEGLSSLAEALVCATGRKWREAKNAVEKGS